MFKRYCCVLQKDEKDRAPAILTIAKQYNSNFSIAKLWQISGTDRNGTNLVGMIKGLDYLGFDSKAVKVEDKKIDNSVSFPIIAHIQSKNNFLHYVVVHDVSNKRIIISDPESGIKKFSHKEFSEIWTGILLLIEPKKDFQKRNEKDNSLTRFFYVLKNQKSLLFNIFLASILYTVLGINARCYNSCYRWNNCLYPKSVFIFCFNSYITALCCNCIFI
ncbi:cysteine peptidase family C39 domain-containing protein [Leptotrichia massiliensis]|uniref:cysteine peptidase family C39 domain-containing protein n=1 Tax=Leptotrichia massiliensis TaxID=1852388 RepID=UPI0028D4692E|nr:cysteine peptidase family C39 domain-containing protein [Leptotrichia massiliensis]